METSKPMIQGRGFLAGALLILLTSTVSTFSFPQAASWPEPPGIESLKQQLGASEANKGKNHPDLVEILLNLGNAYRDEGGYVPATPYVERALSIEEKAHGSESLEVAATLDKLGTLYLLQGDTARARAAYMRARPTLLRELGKDKPAYGLFLMHVGELELLAGHIKEAQEAVDQALTAFGGEISHAAQEWTEANRMLGLLFLGLSKYKEAEQQLVYCLTVRSEALNSENQDKALFYMASANNSLGQFYVTVGRNDEAEPLLLDALRAYEKQYGKNHPLLEDVLVNLAALYENKGDASKGRDYAERVQALHRLSSGYSHLSDWPVRSIIRATPQPRPTPTSVEDAAEIRLGAVTGSAAATQEPILLRLDAPVGRVTQYHRQTQSWLPGFSTTTPENVMTDFSTESVTAAEGDVRTLSTVVVSSQMDMPEERPAKNVLKGMTTIRRVDSRGRVLSSEVTKSGKGMQGGAAAEHAASTFTLPEGPVRVGDTWTATETMPLGPGTAGRTATLHVAYRLERIGSEGGERVAVVSMNGTVTGWLELAGLYPHQYLAPSSRQPSGTLTGEIHIGLSAKRIVGLTMSMEDGWGTKYGLKTRMTMTVQ